MGGVKPWSRPILFQARFSSPNPLFDTLSTEVQLHIPVHRPSHCGTPSFTLRYTCLHIAVHLECSNLLKNMKFFNLKLLKVLKICTI